MYHDMMYAFVISVQSLVQRDQEKDAHNAITRLEQAELEETFTRLAEQWKREIKHMSLMSDIVAHPAYQEIIKMDQQAWTT